MILLRTFLIIAVLAQAAAAAESFQLALRTRVPAADAGPAVIRETTEDWSSQKTAVIVCDMWDSHHGYRAAMRTGELAPCIDALITAARARGSFIIHCPSDCMEHYREHPARKRAMDAPAARALPEGIDKWLYWKTAEEEKAGYPIDHSDGGEDDTPEEHDKWAADLEKQGRKPAAPWRQQHPAVKIDSERDAVTDKGVEVWNLLAARGIDHVLLCGVHLNMCVCGRPFGLRQLSRAGIKTALVRDLTDTMYNPARPPRVSHFQGTELMQAHVERWICPSITSDQVLGGAPFHFRDDARRGLVMLISEDEYRTADTLPAFGEARLAADFRLTICFGSDRDPNVLTGTGAISSADLLLVSTRRRSLPQAQLDLVRKHVSAGKPVMGIRTASHSFAPRRGAELPAGSAWWPEWDAEVLGGNYQNHHGKDLLPAVTITPGAETHPILAGLPAGGFPSTGSLYLNTPLRPGAEPLLTGTITGKAPEPVAWTFTTAAGGRVFYTSLGHADEFRAEALPKLLTNAARWCVAAK